MTSPTEGLSDEERRLRLNEVQERIARHPAHIAHYEVEALVQAVFGVRSLAVDEGDAGARAYVSAGPGLNRELGRVTDPPSSVAWETAPLDAAMDLVGDVELRLDASITAIDTAWIALLQDVAPDGTTTTVTEGWLQASLRDVDEPASRPGAPVVPCRTPRAVPPGETVAYRIPLVPNARRFAAGHRVRLLLCSDDQPDDIPAVMGFRHAPVGTTSCNTVHSSSRLVLSVVTPTADADRSREVQP